MPSDKSAGLDPAAFVDLYEAQADALLLWFARRVLDAEVAFDLMAETFAQAFVSRARFRGKGRDDPARWLYGIARHQLSRYQRKGYAERRALSKLGIERPTAEPEELERIEELAELETLRGEIAAGLLQLGPAQQEALKLRVVQELPYDEVARRLGTSEQTARARVSRALAALRNLLERSTPTTEEATG